MHNLKKFLGIILLFIFIFAGCSENISDPQPADIVGKTLAKKSDFYKQVAAVMQQNNLGQGAYFIEPQAFGYGIGIGKNIVIDFSTFTFISGEMAFFSGTYGTGDFWRKNKNGTVSVKLTTNQAEATHFDFVTGQTLMGIGQMNTKFTGTVVEFPVDFPPYVLTFLVEDPNINSWLLHGHATVTLDGAGGESHKLDMHVLINPGQQGHVDFTLK